MVEFTELKAETRERTGKGGSREMRRQQRVPAIVYGDAKSPVNVSLEYAELWKQVKTGSFLSTVFTLDVGGEKTRVIPKELQVDPVKDFPIHVDFLRLGEGASITVEVPVTFTNEEASPGLKRGGVLNVVRHTIEIRCPADAIPEIIEADIGELDIGDSLHISAISLPDNVEPTITDRDFTIVTVAGRMAETVEDEDEGEAVEGEEGAEDAEGEGDGGED